MPHIVPSDIVSFIDRGFYAVFSGGEQGLTAALYISDGTVNQFETLLSLLEHLPDNLLVLDSRSFADFLAARPEVESGVRSWRSLSFRDKAALAPAVPLSGLATFGGLTSVGVIRRELAKCPDQAPSPAASELTFIPDPTYRQALRLDLSSIGSALAHDEWKAATVLSGSVIEALLMWALELRSPELSAAISSVSVKGKFKLPAKQPPPTNLPNWVLYQYLQVARELDEIDENTAAVVDQVRDFRNLIHPGKAVRLGQSCTRGTAHVAYGAVELVIEDLQERHS